MTDRMVVVVGDDDDWTTTKPCFLGGGNFLSVWSDTADSDGPTSSSHEPEHSLLLFG
jgi:hypothetical protein